MNGANVFAIPQLDSELLHFALAALAALFACVCSIVGVALGFMVKRALSKWFERQDEFDKRLKTVEDALGSTEIVDGRAKNRLERRAAGSGLGDS